jgi:putative nucleotidyltransferase with HDIG domain
MTALMTDSSPRPGIKRVGILTLMLLALLLVSLLPLWFYHRRVVTLSQDRLELNEKLQQTEITRLLAESVQQYDASLHQQLIGQREIFRLAGLLPAVDDPKRSQQVLALLESFIKNNPDFLYVTAIGRSAKGPWAEQGGGVQLGRDRFITEELQRAYVTTIQKAPFHSDPLAFGADNVPALVVAVPLVDNDEFRGMLASVISLDRLRRRLEETSVLGREVYIVNRNGRVVAHPQPSKVIAGTDVSGDVAVVARFKGIPADQTQSQTFPFEMKEGGEMVPMIGTFSTVPELHWAVVAQRRVNDMRAVSGIDELNAQALRFMAAMVLISGALAYFFAHGITRPISHLADSTRAISRGEFKERAPVQGAAEISELAETFNKMAGSIEQYIEKLKQAAEENRELFIGSIRMLAAAIDEKDPYTRGHSGRVAKYSMIIGEEMGLNADDLDRLRIAALLHDVGKIGIDDRVLKKPGALTPEEFEVMKQHTVKGANIMRPVAHLKEMLPGIELHHEHMDGRGYPYGLSGDQIPLMARIIGVADTLDAMTTNRPYQTAFDLNFATQRIRQLTGTKFDPSVVDAYERAVEHGRLKLSATLMEV